MKPVTPNIELLAPGGDVDAIKAAIIAGADAVYCGLDTFNARNRAANISFEQLTGIIRLAHQYQCQIFLTLNIVILEHEFKTLAKLLSQLVNTTLDGVIVQDLGLFYLIKKYFPSLDIHASTQLTTHNAGQIPFLKKLGASRVNLSREMNLREITALTQEGNKHDVLMEVFVHGSLCVAFSGLCYSTSASVGNSGNRGRCSQACREEYETTASGNNFPLNLKDNSAFFDLPALVDAGVHSFKIEGRIKGASYVHTVVDSFRKQLDGYLSTGELLEDGERLYKVFNRDFSNAFLRGDLNQSMFIDNPLDNAKQHALAKVNNAEVADDALFVDATKDNTIPVLQIEANQAFEEGYHQERAELKASVEDKIKHLSIAKVPLTLVFSGSKAQPLTVTVSTEGFSVAKQQFVVKTSSVLRESETGVLDAAAIEKRFKAFNNAEYDLVVLSTEAVASGLSIPFKELTQLKNEVARLLNNDKPVLPAVELPPLKRYQKETGAQQQNSQAKLALLICDPEDVVLADKTAADIYFKLPDAYKRGCTKYVDFLKENPRLIPWFPSVLIGKDYDVAINILEQVKPAIIVTNNTGIAQRAFELGVDWIAGPFLNTTNSYALLAFKEAFNCRGAFISNEINHRQIKHIARPENFKMMYSIYHPILLMASRQCFFQQSVGCDKPRIDNGCMLSCDKSTSITNLKGDSFAIDKQKAGYPSIYNQDQFLNTEIISDLHALFDDFLIDLTNIGMGDKTPPNKLALIEQFEALLALPNSRRGPSVAQAKQNEKEKIVEVIDAMVPQSTNTQYHNGL